MIEAPRPVILVCGSAPRKGRPGFTNRAVVVEVVDSFPPEAVVVEGGAPGPDRWARFAAEARGIHVAEVRALWSFHRKPAGHKRNAAMLALRPSQCCAFWDGSSPGTRDMFTLCYLADIPVTIYREDGSHELVLAD